MVSESFIRKVAAYLAGTIIAFGGYGIVLFVASLLTGTISASVGLGMLAISIATGWYVTDSIVIEMD